LFLKQQRATAGNGQQNKGTTENGAWACSPKQQGLILRITEEHKLEKNQVEALALERFGKGVKALKNGGR
jgi:hypothetical protein